MRFRSLLLPLFIAFCAYFAYSPLFDLYHAKSPFRILQHLGISTMSTTNAPGAMTQWVKGQLEGLFGARGTDRQNFDNAFSDAFTTAPKITFNDEKIGLSDFKERLEASHFAVQQVEIEWPRISEHPAQDKHDGVVFGSFNVRRLSKIRIRAGPAEHRQSVTFEAKLDEAGDDKSFKIAELSITSTDEAAPIHLAGIPGQPS